MVKFRICNQMSSSLLSTLNCCFALHILLWTRWITDQNPEASSKPPQVKPVLGLA